MYGIRYENNRQQDYSSGTGSGETRAADRSLLVGLAAGQVQLLAATGGRMFNVKDYAQEPTGSRVAVGL
jgi:hypothetical protein